MKISITAVTLFKCLYWALYLCLFFASCWFASGVVVNFLSEKTSISQFEGISNDWPVIVIIIKSQISQRVKSVKLKYWRDVKINYCLGYSTAAKFTCKLLMPQSNNSISVNDNF